MGRIRTTAIIVCSLALFTAACTPPQGESAPGESATRASGPSAPGGPEERSFHFRYTAQVRGIPDDAGRVEVWLPYPVSNTHQEISDVQIDSPYPTRVERDERFGNAILYLAAEDPGAGSFDVEVSYKVRRREYLRRSFETVRDETTLPEDVRVWLKPDKLVPLDTFVRELAAGVTAGAETDLEKARAIYDYVVANMKYDKTGTGWGRGDIYHACEVKKGNCTDFHALFIGLCRSVGIPAKFAIGFPIPAERGEGRVGGYHCWAEFYLRGVGWVPVDTSEASKDPSKREYFFGAHDENRFELSIGRDIVLEPPQSGDPVNFFVYPYVEVDGRPFEGIEKAFAYRDLAPAAGASAS